jgi:diguanylate cyclase (GGDEF)-like protein
MWNDTPGQPGNNRRRLPNDRGHETMKEPLYGQTAIAPEDRDRLIRKKGIDNLRRGGLLAKVTIGFELLLMAADVLTALLRVDNRFQFGGYFFMYALLTALNIGFLLGANALNKSGSLTPRRLKQLNRGILVYLTLTMTWGSVMALMDQKLYGQLTAFMVPLMISSILFILEDRERWIPFGVSVLTLAVGLPFFQPSQDILIGDFVNLAIFVITAWVASRVVYHHYLRDFSVTLLLEASNAQLEHEIDENQEMNRQLVLANRQLKNMALLDELTGAPNRRAFRNYIDIAFDACGDAPQALAVLLIDIDHFKQYNDHCGHDVGDRVLVKVAGLIDTLPKGTDRFFCRWGGDEFVILQMNATQEKTHALAESIRCSVRETQLPSELSEVDHYVSVSIGVGVVKAAVKKDVSRVLRLADEALIRAKNDGRDRIECVVQ